MENSTIRKFLKNQQNKNKIILSGAPVPNIAASYIIKSSRNSKAAMQAELLAKNPYFPAKMRK